MPGERVLVVEDEPGIAMTIEDGLTAEGYIVSLAADGIRGEAAARTGAHDVLVLDLMLPERDGMTVCRNLRRAGLKMPILMLTARGTSDDIVSGLRQGADDYLTKPFDMAVLVARIDALLRRARTSGQSTAAVHEFDGWVLDDTRGDLVRNGTPVGLNGQEFRLLRYLADHPNRVIDRGEILDRVWGYESGTTTRTVDVHVAKLRHHLGESEMPRHIQTIRGRGYQFKP